MFGARGCVEQQGLRESIPPLIKTPSAQQHEKHEVVWFRCRQCSTICHTGLTSNRGGLANLGSIHVTHVVKLGVSTRLGRAAEVQHWSPNINFSLSNLSRSRLLWRTESKEGQTVRIQGGARKTYIARGTERDGGNRESPPRSPRSGTSQVQHCNGLPLYGEALQIRACDAASRS